MKKDTELLSNTNSPNLNYFFVENLPKIYQKLIENFINGTHKLAKSEGWRDDMMFLHHLTLAFKYFNENKVFPHVKFQKIPNISNDRWNSRAISALLAFVLIPSSRDILFKIGYFIAYLWANFWFRDQSFCEYDFVQLKEICQPSKRLLNLYPYIGTKNHHC